MCDHQEQTIRYNDHSEEDGSSCMIQFWIFLGIFEANQLLERKIVLYRLGN
jgi:hypothetical protein